MASLHSLEGGFFFVFYLKCHVSAGYIFNESFICIVIVFRKIIDFNCISYWQ